MPLPDQLSAIRKRLLSDTNIFVKEGHPDRIKTIDSLGARVYGETRPVIMVDGMNISIDNNTKSTKIVELSKLISESTIKGVVILSGNEPETIALFGSRGIGGVIIMTSTQKKYSKKFRRLNIKYSE
ncbi:MAG TPA: hypothetical protein VGQ53_11740 [Chitinophagaceae bacterium]|jgi:hypothetical protein|nr:hypothetical protein [Chitinophagaceae bacterium]